MHLPFMKRPVTDLRTFSGLPCQRTYAHQVIALLDSETSPAKMYTRSNGKVSCTRSSVPEPLSRKRLTEHDSHVDDACDLPNAQSHHEHESVVAKVAKRSPRRLYREATELKSIFSRVSIHPKGACRPTALKARRAPLASSWHGGVVQTTLDDSLGDRIRCTGTP